MCLVCYLDSGKKNKPAPREILRLQRIIKKAPNIPFQLVCNTDGLYSYQNPGHAADNCTSPVFNEKHDLDILHKLGMSPGDTRPARDLIERLLSAIPSARNMCGYKKKAGFWAGCPRAFSGSYERALKNAFKKLITPRSAGEKYKIKKISAGACYQEIPLKIRPHHLMCMACFYSRQKFAPIAEDNLFEAIEVIQKNPALPIQLVRGCCMICPPCSMYDPGSKKCIGGHGMGLRDQKKDLDVLHRLDLVYDTVMPARKLFTLLFQRIISAKEICNFDNTKFSGEVWTSCGTAATGAYEKSRATLLDLPVKKGV